MSNFRYNIKPKLSKDPVADGANKFQALKPDSYTSFDADCGASMVGFVQEQHGHGTMKNHKIQCFYAKQVEHSNVEKSEFVDKGDGVRVDKIVEKNGKLVEQPKNKVQTVAQLTEDVVQ